MGVAKSCVLVAGVVGGALAAPVVPVARATTTTLASVNPGALPLRVLPGLKPLSPTLALWSSVTMGKKRPPHRFNAQDRPLELCPARWDPRCLNAQCVDSPPP